MLTSLLTVLFILLFLGLDKIDPVLSCWHYVCFKSHCWHYVCFKSHCWHYVCFKSHCWQY